MSITKKMLIYLIGEWPLAQTAVRSAGISIRRPSHRDLPAGDSGSMNDSTVYRNSIHVRKIGLTLLIAASACSSGPSASSSDARDAKTPCDAIYDARNEAAMQVDAHGDSPSQADLRLDAAALFDAKSGDAGGPLAPKPPSGAMLCGNGTFTLSGAVAECQMGVTVLTIVKSGCSTMTMSGGEWQAWCTSTSTYFWAKFKDVKVVASTGCKVWYADGMYISGSGGGSCNAHTHPLSDITDSSSTDVAVWVTVGPKPTTVSLYLAASPDTFSCKGTTAGPYLMLGVEAKVK